MLYLVHFLRTGFEGSISKAKFYKSLQTATPDSLHTKAINAKNYCDKNIFGDDPELAVIAPGNWGALLTS